MGVFRSTAPPRRESDAEGSPPSDRRTQTASAGSVVRVCVRICVCVCAYGRRATRRCMCVCVGSGRMARRRWVKARDDNESATG